MIKYKRHKIKNKNKIKDAPKLAMVDRISRFMTLIICRTIQLPFEKKKKGEKREDSHTCGNIQY